MGHERENPAREEATANLRRRLVDEVPVSVLCDEHQSYPTDFYHWLKQF
jgi:hypothetical protein